MSSARLYVLDANVFIEAAERYYAFDLVPAFWDNLVALGKAGHICTIDRIADEIKGSGPLKIWVDGAFADYVHDCGTEQVLNHYAGLMQWAQSQPFTDAAKTEFASVADAWLVAYAKAVGGTVVTHETFDANCRRKVKIPNACDYIDVPYVDTFEMLRALRVTLGTR